MFKKSALFLALAGAVSSSVFAAGAADAGIARTRAEVIAQLQAARAAGELPLVGEEGPVAKATVSTKTRAEVIAELEAARAAGTLQRPGEEDNALGWTGTSTKTRGQVRAEYNVYVKSGQQARDRATIYVN